MATISNGTLARKLSDMMSGWRSFVNQLNNWLGGTADGGPSGDGTYPLTDSLNNTFMIKSPARLQADVENVVDGARAHKDAAQAAEDGAKSAQMYAEAARDSAQEAATSASTSASTAEEAKSTALNAETNARAYRTQAKRWAAEQVGTFVDPVAGLYSALHYATKALESNVEAQAAAGVATTKADEAAYSEMQASLSEDNALISELMARDWAEKEPNKEVAPGEYSAKHWARVAQQYAAGVLRYRGSFDASSGVYPLNPEVGDFYKVSVAGNPGGLDLSVGDQIIYNGSGWDKIDNTEQVTSVAGKVGAVTLHISDITSLQSILDGKTNVGHKHSAADITSGTLALARIPDLSSLYAAASHKHDSLYAPLSHTHTIAQIAGLQTTLDGKAASSHSHVIQDVAGLQDALDAATSGYLPLTGGQMSGTLVIEVGTGGTAIDLRNNDIIGVNRLVINDSGVGEGIRWPGWDVYEDGYLYLISSGTARVRVENSYGNVVIGPANTSWCHFATDRGKFHFNKEVHANGGFQNYSDRRLKDHLETVDLLTLPLETLDLHRFIFRGREGDQAQESFGIYAQELQDVAPWMVSEDEAGYLTLNESRVALAVALKALHVLKERGLLDGIRIP